MVLQLARHILAIKECLSPGHHHATPISKACLCSFLTWGWLVLPCAGTGALTLGKERFCSLEGGCKPCPVCNAKVKLFHNPPHHDLMAIKNRFFQACDKEYADAWDNLKNWFCALLMLLWLKFWRTVMQLEAELLWNTPSLYSTRVDKDDNSNTEVRGQAKQCDRLWRDIGSDLCPCV